MTVQYVEVRRALGDARVTVAGCGNGHRIVRAPGSLWNRGHAGVAARLAPVEFTNEITFYQKHVICGRRQSDYDPDMGLAGATSRPASMAQGNSPRKRVVIVGAGFGGLAAARALRHTRVSIILIDRSNHHLFQPLLYQVATSVLSPGQIGSPIRQIFKRQSNATVAMGEVTGVNKESKRVFVSSLDRQDVPVEYDYLVLATGVRHSYFGHKEFEKFAPGLKTLADAVAIRNRILSAFEQAEAEEDPARHKDLLTFVFVGAGPTGVEMAAALAVMIRSTLKSEFRRIDPSSARIVLVDMADRVLGAFSKTLSAAAEARLRSLGVEVKLGHGAEQIDESGIIVGGQKIASKTVIWTAGVEPSPAGKWLNAETDRSGRVRVEPDLTLPGHPEIYVIGDTAFLEQDGKPLPGVAQVAMQQGRYVGAAIERRLRGVPPTHPFRYFDKGSMAVVGKEFAVLQSGRIQLKGFVAWLAWAAIHLEYLAQSNLRVSVFVQWVLDVPDGTARVTPDRLASGGRIRHRKLVYGFLVSIPAESERVGETVESLRRHELARNKLPRAEFRGTELPGTAAKND